MADWSNKSYVRVPKERIYKNLSLVSDTALTVIIRNCDEKGCINLDEFNIFLDFHFLTIGFIELIEKNIIEIIENNIRFLDYESSQKTPISGAMRQKKFRERKKTLESK